MILGRNIEEIKDKELIQLNCNDLIQPLIGLGGLSFSRKISEFSGNLISFENDKIHSQFNVILNDVYFYLSLISKDGSTKITFDIFTGRIIGFECFVGYTGKTIEGIGIGMSIKLALSIDSSLGFDLDYDVFCRSPFDGLLIYPPNNLRDECINAACSNGEYPDFNIDSILILEKEYYKKHLEHLS